MFELFVPEYTFKIYQDEYGNWLYKYKLAYGWGWSTVPEYTLKNQYSNPITIEQMVSHMICCANFLKKEIEAKNQKNKPRKLSWPRKRKYITFSLDKITNDNKNKIIERLKEIERQSQ